MNRASFFWCLGGRKVRFAFSRGTMTNGEIWEFWHNLGSLNALYIKKKLNVKGSAVLNTTSVIDAGVLPRGSCLGLSAFFLALLTSSHFWAGSGPSSLWFLVFDSIFWLLLMAVRIYFLISLSHLLPFPHCPYSWHNCVVYYDGCLTCLGGAHLSLASSKRCRPSLGTYFITLSGNKPTEFCQGKGTGNLAIYLFSSGLLNSPSLF